MNKLQNFTNGIFNLDVKVEGEEVLFSAEQVAKSLGFITVYITENTDLEAELKKLGLNF